MCLALRVLGPWWRPRSKGLNRWWRNRNFNLEKWIALLLQRDFRWLSCQSCQITLLFPSSQNLKLSNKGTSETHTDSTQCLDSRTISQMLSTCKTNKCFKSNSSGRKDNRWAVTRWQRLCTSSSMHILAHFSHQSDTQSASKWHNRKTLSWTTSQCRVKNLSKRLPFRTQRHSMIMKGLITMGPMTTLKNLKDQLKLFTRLSIQMMSLKLPASLRFSLLLECEGMRAARDIIHLLRLASSGWMKTMVWITSFKMIQSIHLHIFCRPSILTAGCHLWKKAWVWPTSNERDQANCQS